MNRKVFFSLLLMVCISTICLNQKGVFKTTFAQSKQKPDEKQGSYKKDNHQNVSNEIHELLNTEKEDSTTSQNVQERYRKLGAILSQQIRAGAPVDNVLSKEEGERINALLRRGAADEAAEMVHEAIMKLEESSESRSQDKDGKSITPQSKQKPDEKQGSYKKDNHQNVSNEIHELLNTEKEDSTTSQNVQERYRKLGAILSQQIRAGAPIDNVLSKEEGERINALLRKGATDEAAEMVHEAIMKLEESSESRSQDKDGKSITPQSKQKPDEKQGSYKKDNHQNVSNEIHELLNTEKEDSTTSQNVQERYRKLGAILSQQMRAGMPVDNVLSKDEGERINTLLREGTMDEAAEMVHDAIMKLEDIRGSQGKAEKDAMKEGGQTGVNRFGSKRQKSLQEEMPLELVSSAPLTRLNIYQMVSKNTFGNILKLMNPVIDSERRRLYFSGTKSTSIGVLDLDKNELIETFDIGTPGGFLLLDPKTGDIYLFIIGVDIFFKIDMTKKKASRVSSLPNYLSLPEKGVPEVYENHTYTNTGYPFLAGYLQSENAAYGIIKVRDAGRKVVDQIKYGPNSLYFTIDQKTGRLYTTNTGDSSISVFDLKDQRKKLKDINVGISVEEVILNSSNDVLYIRNRLGGNTIYYYDLNTCKLGTIPNENMSGSQGIGMWPTQMIYDDGKLYVLSHYGGRIDIIDTVNHKIVNRIVLDLSYKPRTDAISAMVMDKKRKRLYAVFPELGELSVADAGTLKAIKTIKVRRCDKTEFGPAGIVLSVNERLNKLYVYLSSEKILQVYDCGSYSLERSISVNAERVHDMMTSNPAKGLLYLGNKILDAETLEMKGRFSKGQRVIAFDNSKNRVYLVDMIPLGPAKMIEKVYEYEGLSLKKEWILSPIISIPSSFAFDFSNNKFYVGYFESAVVEAFDLTSKKI